MSARYEVGDDADNDPTIWDTSGSPRRPRAILRRSDLPETARELWPAICEAVTGETACTHEHVRTFRSIPPHSKCEDCGARVKRIWVTEVPA